MSDHSELAKLIYCHEYLDEAAGTLRDCEAISERILASKWLADRDAEIRAGALESAADDYTVNLTAMAGPRIRDWLRKA